ncbi:MAG: SURF1 family protein [Jatrophihabitantaceae bacterium]
MLRTSLRALRQPRYARLSALMLLVAIVCVGAGTWQIVRFEGKVHDNDVLTANAHRPAVPVTRLLPLVGGPGVSADSVRYRTVTATGRYDSTHDLRVRLRSVDGQDGDLLLTPLDTRAGVLLVVRGLLSTLPDVNPPPVAPAGRVSIRARVQASEANRDGSPAPARSSVLSINAPVQQARLGVRVFDGYVELLPGQPGAAGLVAVSPPDLSNPAGGAVEPQHFAYIVQWYLFALLALAAPFAMMRADRRGEPDAEPEPQERPADPSEPTDEQRRAAKLADRYGRA